MLDDFACGAKCDRRAGARQPRGQVRRLRRACVSPRAPDAGDVELALGAAPGAWCCLDALRDAIRSGGARRQSRRARRRGHQVRHGRLARGFLSLLRGMPSRHRTGAAEFPARGRRRSGGQDPALRAAHLLSPQHVAQRTGSPRQDPDAAGNRPAPIQARGRRVARWRRAVGPAAFGERDGCEPKRATGREATRCCARATRVCARACRTSPRRAMPVRRAPDATSPRDTRRRSTAKGNRHGRTQRCATGREVAPPLSRSLSSIVAPVCLLGRLSLPALRRRHSRRLREQRGALQVRVHRRRARDGLPVLDLAGAPAGVRGAPARSRVRIARA